MSSREEILNAIRRNKPASVPVPQIELPQPGPFDMLQRYQQSVEKNGGKFKLIQSTAEIGEFVKERFPQAKNICSLIEGVEGNVKPALINDPHEFDNLDVVVMQASIGVAENAANWIPETAMGHRVIPFITQHLIIVVNSTDLVGTMHDAYNRISFPQVGYGVFIAGPSKTADIEQSLVIGAHGPRSLDILIL